MHRSSESPYGDVSWFVKFMRAKRMRSYSYIQEKCLDFLGESSNGEYLYLLAFVVFLIGENLRTTMFPVPGTFYLITKLLALGILCMKVMLFGQYRIGKLCLLGSMLLEAVLVYASSSYQEPLMWMLFVVAADGVAFEKILKVYVVVTSTVVLAAILASSLGVIKNLQYKVERGVRNSFGIVYPTDFAAHIFYLMITVLYLGRKNFRWWYSLACLTVAGVVYYFCNTRLDSSCMVLAALGYMVLYRKQNAPESLRRKYRPVDWVSRCGIYSMPLAALIMFLISGFYSYENKVLDTLNIWLSSRLALGKRGLTEYPVTLFGQWVYMLGNGSTEKLPSGDKYFFIDCSYLYNFMRYGLIFLLIVLAVYVACCRKYRMDHYFLLTIVLVSLNCMIAHHLIELAYNPFALALMADSALQEKKVERRGTECCR